MEINVRIEPRLKTGLDIDWLKKLAGEVLKAEKAPDTSELSLLITTEKRIRELNRTYLDEDAPTDVLSFPMEPQNPNFIAPPDGKLHLGEVIISYPQAGLQAEMHGHSIKKEIAVLLIHGALHILGYDHAKRGDELRMRTRELEVLKLLEKYFR